MDRHISDGEFAAFAALTPQELFDLAATMTGEELERLSVYLEHHAAAQAAEAEELKRFAASRQT